jgi:YD repeat-containing protein
MLWTFEHLNFGFVSNFDIGLCAISDLLFLSHYANKRANRIPIRDEEGIDALDITDIRYTSDLQVSRIRGKYKDTAWVGGSGSNNTPWSKADYREFINTDSIDISYNGQGLVSKVTGPDTIMSYTYDAHGNLMETKNTGIDKSTKYSYDSDHNLIAVQYPDGKVTQMVYDDDGLLTEVINNDNTKVTISRNTRGEIMGITDEENRTVTLERDIMGRITKETSPSGRTVGYEWGGTGCGSCGSGSDVELTKVIDSGNNIWEFKYDIMGNATEMIYPET